MSDLWNGIRDLFVSALDALHSLFSFVGDEPAWGFAIIALTLIVRIMLLPLAIKQTRSMRAMQQLQPKIKAIQKKHKADRELMKKDPERYKAQRQKMNEEMTALYKDAGVNPAGGCLPLIAQAPIFIALFSVLRTPVGDNPNLVPDSALDRLLHADFYFFTPGPEGLSMGANQAGIAGIALILLMAGSMFWSQRQMLAKTAVTADSSQMQQQKIMMYVMPVFLAVISFNFPMGVLLYWVTTNIWQIAQQAIILYEVDHTSPAPNGGDEGTKGGQAQPPAKGKDTPAGKAGNKRPAGTSDGTNAPKKAPKNAPKDSPTGNRKGSKASGKGSKASGPAASGNGKGSSNGKPSGQRRPGSGGSPAKGSPGHIPSRRSRRERE